MNKIKLKQRIVELLKNETEVERIIVFGSFNHSDSPNDIDIAVIQNSTENYLSLSLKYRRLIREITKEIAVDIFPVINNNNNSFFNKEILSGEVIYAKRN